MKKSHLWLALIFLLAAANFFTGLNWGLPSRDADEFLFAGRVPWTGQQIMDLAGNWDQDSSRGADIAMHPLQASRDQAILLNETDAQRAEIVRRYRLYSSQPDEMITFRSLSRMKPAQLHLDPGLYQYGGLWIYPVGALLKLGSVFHLITLRGDLAYYLDHPQDFARFYLVARAYSALWGMMGVAVVYLIGREWTGQTFGGLTAAALYAVTPVVINLAHEAKPHLAGSVLILLTILSAMYYARTGQRRWWISAGAAAGAAAAMVLTGYVAFSVLLVLAWLRPVSAIQRMRITGFSLLIGASVFVLTNPYLPINVLFHRQILQSNVGNYGTFYHARLSTPGLILSARSLIWGLSPGPLLIGILGAIVLIWRWGRARRRLTTGLLLAIPALLVLLQFVLLAGDQSAEYARFALLCDIMLIISAAALINQLQFQAREKMLAALLLIAATFYFGLRYEINYLADKRIDSTRIIAAKKIDQFRPLAHVIDVWSEPAPYCAPPVDLFHWQIVLMPKGSNMTGGRVLGIRPVDVPVDAPKGSVKVESIFDPGWPISPMSWANKPFTILKR